MTQNQKISKLLNSGKAISLAQAKSTYKIGCLTARITELRQAGLNIIRTKNSAGITAYKLAA
jgi:Helix-turn-helix domain